MNNKDINQYQDRHVLEEMSSNDGMIVKGHVNEGDKLIEATLTALETGSLMPLIKQELKYTILSRRIAEGKGEMKVTFGTPKKIEITPEEMLKVNKRREQNRMASRKFRRKQRENRPMIDKRIQTLEENNTHLGLKLLQLKKERDQLLYKLNVHLACCHNLALKNS